MKPAMEKPDPTPQPSKKPKITPSIPAPVPEPPILFKNHRMILGENERFHQKFKKWIFHVKVTRLFKHKLSKKTFPLVEQVVKKATRSLICFTYDVQSKGFCLAKGTFCPNNLVLCYGEIKLKKVEVTKFNKKKAAENFRDLSNWISDSFFKDKKDIPVDMARVLTLLKTDHRKEYLIRNHLAFMNGRGRRDFICKWYDCIHQYSNDGWQRYLKACSHLPNPNDWATLIDKTDPLHRVYIKRLGRAGEYKDLPEEQPRFFRHSLSHLVENCRMDAPHAPPQFYYDDCVNILFAVFPESITAFPELLDQEKLLKGLRPEAYFYS